MDEQKQTLVDKLKGANNILVTVSANPSLDQLSAAIGFTLYLNKLKKHATAVFSGDVPSKLGFLQPEDTLEKTTDSLRDFIISLDKAKADKLRYKVEENVVKIFITPYRTSLTKDDLEFGQGDFNVDLVVALGVHEQKDLDQAIVAHGRILHDATVTSVNVHAGPELGSINWVVENASSLSELVVELVEAMNKDELDGQIATALLTGIVAETERFSNDKTSPETMRLSAELLTAGANQQLVSTELQKEDKPAEKPDNSQTDDAKPKPKPNDGTIEINHTGGDGENFLDVSTLDDNHDNVDAPIKDIKQNTFDYTKPETSDDSHSQLPPQVYVGDTPSQQGQLTANMNSEDQNYSEEPKPDVPLLGRKEKVIPTGDLFEANKPEAGTQGNPTNDDILRLDQLPGLSIMPDTPEPAMELPKPAPISLPPVPPPSPLPPTPPAKPKTDLANVPTTLAEIEKAVHSPHLPTDAPTPPKMAEAPKAPLAAAEPDLDAALKAVQDVYNNTPVSEQTMPPKQDVAASGYFTVQDLPDFQPNDAPGKPPLPYVPEPKPGNTPADTPLTMPLPPSSSMPNSTPNSPTVPGVTPPPVPPPLPPSMTTH